MTSITPPLRASGGGTPGGLGETLQKQAGWTFLHLTKMASSRSTFNRDGSVRELPRSGVLLFTTILGQTSNRVSRHNFTESRANLKILNLLLSRNFPKPSGFPSKIPRLRTALMKTSHTALESRAKSRTGAVDGTVLSSKACGEALTPGPQNMAVFGEGTSEK